MKVPWFRLYSDDEELKAVTEVVKSGWMSMGPKVKEFEKKMASYVGVKHAVAVNSGTAALDVGLKALGIGPGDEVIVPALAYIATANSVLFQHATPIFADIDKKTFNMAPEDVERKITPKTKGIIPIDYGGQAADYNALREIADRHGLFILEDGAPGLGGAYEGKRICSLGDISITSFHVAKSFTSIEGGMVFTDNGDYAKLATIIRSHGEDSQTKYNHIILGHNYRMTDINAAIGIVQTGRMEDVLVNRKRAVSYYNEKLNSINGLKTPFVEESCTHSWSLYSVLLERRDEVKKYLADNGIETIIGWPMPIYNQKSFKNYKRDICPVAEEVSGKILNLPLFYKMPREEQDHVINHLIKAVNQFT